MAGPTTADSEPLPAISQSSRDLWEVLVGEDAAQPIIEASLSGDNSAIKNLLSQPQWIKAMFEEQHVIHSEDRPKESMNDERGVMARPLSNIVRAMTIAAINGHAAVVSTLLCFALQHDAEPYSVILREAVIRVIRHGHTAVFEAWAQVVPNIISFNCGHGALPLYEAVRMRQLEMTALLLRLGADPLHPLKRWHEINSPKRSLMSRAALYPDPRMIELLLEHDVPIAGSGALHFAACYGQFDTARLLIDRGADVNEPYLKHCWTPMHYAAWRCRPDAMELLESYGARSDVKDSDGETPAEVQERVKREKLPWTL